jgi:hypothetical protein
MRNTGSVCGGERSVHEIDVAILSPWVLVLTIAAWTGCGSSDKNAPDTYATLPPDTRSAVVGMACTTNGDCPSGSICCDGSSESCDGTRLPSGDGANSGELVVSSDGLTVTDTITGLVWQRDTSSNTWAEAKAYCAGLTLGGFSDWRLPAVMELLTVVDFTRILPAIDPTAFPNAPTGVFWTSSPYAFLSGDAWLVDFNYGDWDNISVGNGDAVRCVRGSRCYPTSRFVVLAGGLVQDSLTGLVWQQDGSGTGCSGSGTLTCTWAEAQAYCAGLTLGGLSGWRLPTVKELSSLVDFTVALGLPINQTAFPNTTLPSSFWTSSSSAFLPGTVDVNFVGGGRSSFDDVGNDNGVRCVR